jgi:hypothetical protein
LILCLESSLSVGSDLRSFPFLTCVFPWGFDLVFWNQFSVGSGSARSLSFPHLRMFPWGSLVF